MRIVFAAITACSMLGGLTSCRMAAENEYGLSVTNSVPVERPEQAPGAVSIFTLDPDGNTIASASGVRSGNSIITTGHTFYNKHMMDYDHEQITYDIRDFRGNSLMKVQHSPETTVSIDGRYRKANWVDSPHDRAAIIFKDGALKQLDHSMSHYGEHRSALLATNNDKSQFSDPFVVGAGPTGDGFDNLNHNGHLRMTKIRGKLSDDSFSGGLSYEGVVTSTHPDLPMGFGGASRAGDSGGPIYGFPTNGPQRPVVMGITQSGGTRNELGEWYPHFNNEAKGFSDIADSHVNSFQQANDQNGFFHQVVSQGAKLETWDNSPGNIVGTIPDDLIQSSFVHPEFGN